MPEGTRRRRSDKYEAQDEERRAVAEEKETAPETPAENGAVPEKKAEEPVLTDTGSLRYRVGNENRGNGRFGEAQRLAASQPNPVYYPYEMSGANQPVQADPYSQSGAWQPRQQTSPWQTGVGGEYAAYQTYGQPAQDSQPMRNPQPAAYDSEAESEHAPQRNESGAAVEKARKKRRGWLLPTLLGSGVALIGMVFLFVILPIIQNSREAAKAEEAHRELVAAVSVYNEKYCENVWVDGIHLGGMSQQEARDAVTRQSAETFSWSVELTFNGETVRTLNESDVGIHIDIERALEDAWNQGHLGDEDMRWEEMEALKAAPYEGYSVTSDDTSRLDAILALIAQEYYTPAVDATFAGFNADATDPFSFNPEVYGAILDTEGMKTALEHMAENRESGSLELKLIPLAPLVTEASLRAEQYALRGKSTTPISMTKSTEDRNNNIRRAFELISGTVIQPGGKFSFNDIVGKRTIENGFFPAEEYVKGAHEDGIGGGVCQASTTIYQAAVRANMQIDKRTPHSMAVNYTDYGKDATVYWWPGKGGQKLDFAFTNTTDYPIYIKAAVQSSEKNKKNLVCNVWIYGQAMEPGVTYDLDTQENPIPAPETEYVRDKNAKYVTYKDEQYEYQKAEEGTEVLRWLVKYVNGKEVERTQLETDTYAPKPQIIYVGTRERQD